MGGGGRPLRELRYRGTPGRPLASLPDLQERTIALSTLSKICAPGLRIGWVRCPAALHGSLVVAKQAADLRSSTIDQAVAAHWLATVDLPGHLNHLRAVYAKRPAALLGGLRAALPAGSEYSDPDGGMFVWVRVPAGWDAEACLPAALARDVAYVPGSAFFAEAPDPARCGCPPPANPRSGSWPVWSGSPAAFAAARSGVARGDAV